jgi:hypothetical protein
MEEPDIQPQYSNYPDTQISAQYMRFAKFSLARIYGLMGTALMGDEVTYLKG